MPINISEDIFNVVKNMSVSETAHFPKYLKRYKIKFTKEYIFIFRLIRKQSVYNEGDLKRSLGCESISKNFSYHKNTLCEFILDSLVSYHSLTSVNYKLHRLIESAIVLCNKMLYSHAIKLLEKAKEIAIEYEKYYILLEILDVERKVLKQVVSPKLNRLSVLNSKIMFDTFKKIEHESYLSFVNDSIYNIYKDQNLIRDRKAEVEKIMKTFTIKSEKETFTFDSNLKYNNIYALFYQLTGNYDLAIKHRERKIQIWKKNPHILKELPILYRSDLSNLLSVKHKNGDYKNFETILSEIKKMEGATHEDNAEIFREVYYLKHLYLLNNGKINEALSFIPEIEAKLELYKASIAPLRLCSCYYNVAMTYFISGKYRNALTWFNKITSINRNVKVRSDMRDVVGLFEIIIYFETDRYPLAEARIHNLRNKLNKYQMTNSFNKLFFQYMKKLIESSNRNGEKSKLLREFNSKLSALPPSDTKRQLGAEEISLWLRKAVA